MEILSAFRQIKSQIGMWIFIMPVCVLKSAKHKSLHSEFRELLEMQFEI